MRRLYHLTLFASLLAAIACGDDPASPERPGQDGGLNAVDVGSTDAGGLLDGGAGTTDANAVFDAGVDASDLGVRDGAALDGGPVDAGPSSGRPTVYYVIRHTERDPGTDPPINAEGEARAERLADALEQAGIDEIVTTTFIRGQQSGAPLANRTGVPITVAPIPPTSWPAFGTAVGEWQRAREIPGRTYLLIGHSGGYNTALLRTLGGPSGDTLGERYQDLVLLVREPNGVVRLARLQYGGASSLDP